MNLELISFKLCPFVQRAAIMLLEKKVSFKLTTIDLSQRPDWLFKLNPLGKVPILKIDEERVLFESTCINEYLDETLAPRIQTQEAYQKALERAYIAVATDLLWDLKAIYLAPDQGEFRKKEGVFFKKLSWIEDQLDHMRPDIGPQLSFLDIGFAPLFTQIGSAQAYRHHSVWESFPKFTQWSERVLQADSVKKSMTEDFGLELEQFFRDRGSYLFRLNN